MPFLNAHEEINVGLPPRRTRYNPDVSKPLNVSSPIVRDGAEFWDHLRGDRPFPSRRDIDPLTIPRHLLAHTMLIDVMGTGHSEFRWRLIGTHVTAMMGRDSTGKLWRDLYSPDELDRIAVGPRKVLETGLPCRTMTRAPIETNKFIVLESVDLPLSADGVIIDMILAFSHAERRLDVIK